QRGGFNKGHNKNPIKKSYELEKNFYRFLCRFCLSLYFLLFFVRNVDARCASRSAKASSTTGWFLKLLSIAGPPPSRDGVLFHHALCALRSRWRRRRQCDIGHFGGPGVCRATPHFVRGPTPDDENRSRLDHRCRDSIHSRGRNHRPDL